MTAPAAVVCGCYAIDRYRRHGHEFVEGFHCRRPRGHRGQCRRRPSLLDKWRFR